MGNIVRKSGVERNNSFVVVVVVVVGGGGFCDCLTPFWVTPPSDPQPRCGELGVVWDGYNKDCT